MLTTPHGLRFFRYAAAIAIFAGALAATTTRAADSVWSVRVLDETIDYPDGEGDVWTPAWMADGKLFTPSDDTTGFRKACNGNLAVNRLEGDDIAKLKCETVNPMADYGKPGELGPDGCSWKACGCYAVDGVLYVTVSRHDYGHNTGDPKRRQTAQNASIIKSTDGGKTWTRSMQENYDRPTFPGRRFGAPLFVRYGKDGQASVDNADKYVYAISNNGFWDNGDNLALGRVLRSKIADLRGEDWEYYKGGDGMKNSAWANNKRYARFILNDPGKLGMTGAVYIPELNRYLMITWHYPSGSGLMAKTASHTQWEFYESPKPWGPWKKFGEKDFEPQGYYDPEIAHMFSTNGGRRLYAMTSGDFLDKKQKYTHLTFVPFEITVPAEK